MRIARKTFLLAVVAVAAVAALSPPALASEPVESLEPGSLQHCPTIANGGCERHIVGEVLLRTHFFGIEAGEAKCHLEMEGISDEDGNGSIASAVIANGAHGETNCDTVGPPCAGSTPWPSTTEEIAASTVEDNINVCIDPSEYTTCVGVFDSVGVEEGGPGEAEAQHVTITDNRIGSSFCEIDFAGETEGDGVHSGVHTRHI